MVFFKDLTENICFYPCLVFCCVRCVVVTLPSFGRVVRQFNYTSPLYRFELSIDSFRTFSSMIILYTLVRAPREEH